MEITIARKEFLRFQNDVILLHLLYLKHGFAYRDKTFVNSVSIWPNIVITIKNMEKVLTKYKKLGTANIDIMSVLNEL